MSGSGVAIELAKNTIEEGCHGGVRRIRRRVHDELAVEQLDAFVREETMISHSN